METYKAGVSNSNCLLFQVPNEVL